jgi:hypothetical protein
LVESPFQGQLCRLVPVIDPIAGLGRCCHSFESPSTRTRTRPTFATEGVTLRAIWTTSTLARRQSGPEYFVLYAVARECEADGWHRVHCTSFARGGAGLVIVEATALFPEGRITWADLDLWNDTQPAALEPMRPDCACGTESIVEPPVGGR